MTGTAAEVRDVPDEAKTERIDQASAAGDAPTSETEAATTNSQDTRKCKNPPEGATKNESVDAKLDESKSAQNETDGGHSASCSDSITMANEAALVREDADAHAHGQPTISAASEQQEAETDEKQSGKGLDVANKLCRKPTLLDNALKHIDQLLSIMDKQSD